MRSTSLSLLALALAIGACSSDSDPIIADIDQMRVVKVSGDQTSQVPAAASHTIYATAGASLAVLDGLGYTPEPLVARVEAVGMQSRGTGPSSVIPPGTLVHWQIPEVAGRLFGTATAVDDTAHVINRYAPGTKAGTYIAYAGRMVGSEIEIDAEWELVVEPGEIAQVDWVGTWYELSKGDTLTIDLRDHLKGGADRYGNVIAVANIPATLIEWAWTDGQGDPGPTGTGWHAALPSSLNDFPEYCNRTGSVGPDAGDMVEVWSEVCYRSPLLVVWINGIDPARFRTEVGVEVFVRCTIYEPSRVPPDACDAYHQG